MLSCWWGGLLPWWLGGWWLNGNGGFMGFVVVCVGLSVGLVGLLGGLAVAL